MAKETVVVPAENTGNSEEIYLGVLILGTRNLIPEEHDCIARARRRDASGGDVSSIRYPVDTLVLNVT